MVNKIMYYKIQGLKNKGYNKQAIARELKTNRKTVRKYLSMSEEDFLNYRKGLLYKGSVFEIYKKDILDIYKANDNMRINMAAIYDYLEEQHGQLPGTERSFRNYINYLEVIGSLILHENLRVFKKVTELPFGKQMQLDFGEYKCKSGLKVYIFAALLSASRYKFAVLQDTPFKTDDVIQHLLSCFDKFGGIPEEMVIDQDKLMVVSENKGDIIYTNDFKYFKEEFNIKLYVCRKADPQSKGKIENFVGYIKHNFFEFRDFDNVDAANQSLWEWLVRRANGKISQATKRIPAFDINEEREHLRPVRNSIFRKDSILGREERSVNDKAYISILASQYLLPAKYRNKKVEVYITPFKVFVYDIYTGKEIVVYDLSPTPGKNIIKREFKRQNERPLKDLKGEVLALFDFPGWEEFLIINGKRYSRYQRDQYIDALKRYKDKKIDEKIFSEAVKFCIQNGTVSISNLDDTYRYYLQMHIEGKEMLASFCPSELKKPSKSEKHSMDVKRRNFVIYKKIINNRRAG